MCISMENSVVTEETQANFAHDQSHSMKEALYNDRLVLVDT